MFIHPYSYTYTLFNTHTLTHTHTRTRTRTHTNTHKHTHVHTYVHTHVHTRIHRNVHTSLQVKKNHTPALPITHFRIQKLSFSPVLLGACHSFILKHNHSTTRHQQIYLSQVGMAYAGAYILSTRSLSSLSLSLYRLHT